MSCLRNSWTDHAVVEKRVPWMTDTTPELTDSTLICPTLDSRSLSPDDLAQPCCLP